MRLFARIKSVRLGTEQAATLPPLPEGMRWKIAEDQTRFTVFDVVSLMSIRPATRWRRATLIEVSGDLSVRLRDDTPQDRWERIVRTAEELLRLRARRIAMESFAGDRFGTYPKGLR